MATPEQVEALIVYVGGTRDLDDAAAGSAYDQASALVGAYIGTFEIDVPAAIRDGAVLECASKVMRRRSAPDGQEQYAYDGASVGVPKDPMVTARPILDPFLPAGFA